MKNNINLLNKVLMFIGVLMSLVHIYILGFCPIDPWIFLHIHLAFGMLLTFLYYPNLSEMSIAKTVEVIMTLIVAVYFILEANEIPYRIIVSPTIADTIFGLILLLLILEATRKVLGLTLPIVAIIFLLYARYGAILPGFMGHKNYDWITIISQSISTSGILGVSLSASAYFVFMLLLFGAFFKIAGAEHFFIDLAKAIAGSRRGGPAKIAVFASALFGTISGNSVANVIATGNMTIPMMKKIGYKPHIAGAIEAVASTGGQIMPPIMGSAAFIMAQILGVNYFKIVIAALIPAILYFLSLYLMIDLEAGKQGIAGLPKNMAPSIKEVLKKQWFMIIPLIVLVISLVHSTIVRAALRAIILTVVFSFFKREDRMNINKISEALCEGARSSVAIITACGCAGIIVGVIYLTGLGFKISEAILSFSGGSLLLALILSALTAIVLGMGVPTTASYLICAAIVAPAIIKLGIAPLAAHLFILYFACFSAITPPVALAAYAGAGLAGANPMKTGLSAMRLGVVAFIIPFMFIYGPALLTLAAPFKILLSTMTAIIGIASLCIAMEGWIWVWDRKVNPIERILFFIGAIFTIKVGGQSDILGIMLILVGILINKLSYIKMSKFLSKN